MHRVLVISTRNRDKAREIIAVLKDEMNILNILDESVLEGSEGIRIRSLADFPDAPEVIEDRNTIEGNAMKKALEMAQFTGHICLADDTGLFVDALDGAPGVMAARFAGEGCSYRDNRMKVLKLLHGVVNRSACFRTVMALSDPDGIIAIREGIVRGQITISERGFHGFGYDAVFEAMDSRLTFAEMDDEQKNRISHRSLALKAIMPIIKKTFDGTRNVLSNYRGDK